MKRSFSLLVFVILLLPAAVVHAFTPAHLWSQRFGSTYDDIAYSVAVDASGNVYVTGCFRGTVDFGGGNLVSAGNSDIFLAKYSPTGIHLWSKRFGDIDQDLAYSVAVDGSGDVYMTGFFGGTVDFGGGNLVSAGVADIFVVKYGSTGDHQWSQRFGSTSYDNGRSVAVDGSGNVYVTGRFDGTVDFGGGNLVSAGGDDIFLAKYDATFGDYQWSQRFGSTSNDVGYSVAVDGSGNVLVTGAFAGTVNFRGGNLVSAGGEDIFLAKYTPGGINQWSQRFGDIYDDDGESVAVDGSGNVLVTGYFIGTVDFGGGNLVSAGGDDIFLAKYSPTGVHQWSQRFGGAGIDSGNSVAVDGSGNVFVTGRFENTVDFGGGNLVSASAYSYDIFLAKYSGPSAEPVITSIVDIGNDQGRKVRIRFSRSGGDDGTASNPVTSYEAYRRADPTPLVGLESTTRRQLLADGWVQAATISAHADDNYLMDAPTDADSTIALGPYNSTFFIRAATDVPAKYYDSPPDSGYSLDNLAPGVPANFAFSVGTLSWDKSSAEDFDYFTVYGSNTDDFGTSTVVDYAVSPSLDVTASPYVYYFVTATDFSGNEGKPARVNTLSGVGGTPTHYVLSVSNYPNPFNPRTTVSYTVPSQGEVSIVVYDARGAKVATLLNHENRRAGVYSVEWNGRADDGAHVSSGVYFARIDHAGATRTKKMVMLK